MGSKASYRKGKKTGSKLIPVLCNILGTILLLSVILLLLPTVLPLFTDLKVYTVVSGSMEPAIPVGSMVVTAPVEPEFLENRDIIAYQAGDSVIVHRVVSNRPFEHKLTTKGDANEEEDLSPVTYEDVIGKVKYSFKYLGDIEAYVTTGAGKIYVMLVIACGIMFQILAVQLRP